MSAKRTKRPFTMVPNFILDDKDLSGNEKAVYMALAKHANNETGIAYPAIKTLAAKAGVSSRTVSNAKKRLVEKGYVEESSGHRGRANTYRLVGRYKDERVHLDGLPFSGPFAGIECAQFVVFGYLGMLVVLDGEDTLVLNDIYKISIEEGCEIVIQRESKYVDHEIEFDDFMRRLDLIRQKISRRGTFNILEKAALAACGFFRGRDTLLCKFEDYVKAFGDVDVESFVRIFQISLSACLPFWKPDKESEPGDFERRIDMERAIRDVSKEFKLTEMHLNTLEMAYSNVGPDEFRNTIADYLLTRSTDSLAEEFENAVREGIKEEARLEVASIA